MPKIISEDHIEKAIVQKLVKDYGYQSINCYTENPDDLNDHSGRMDKHEVVFHERLKAAAIKLNPEIPEEAIDRTLGILTASRGNVYNRSKSRN